LVRTSPAEVVVEVRVRVKLDREIPYVDISRPLPRPMPMCPTPDTPDSRPGALSAGAGPIGLPAIRGARSNTSGAWWGRRRLGNSLDIGRAGDVSLVGVEKPWLGYFFLMEDNTTSRRTERVERGLLPVDDVWTGRSLQERFSLTAERLLSEGLYPVCYVTSAAEDPVHVSRAGGGLEALRCCD
jgi:hypothetical protein